jgi:hypothetical protein
MTWLFALFLVAHALIHASFVAPQPPATAGGPQWPFDLAHSWILSPLGIDGDATRLLGVALIVVTIAGFGLAALAAVGILGDGTFVPGIAVGSVASLALLAVFFSPWFVVGVGIDAVLLWAVLAARWSPQAGFPG